MTRCEKCHSGRSAPIETVSGKGRGWKCSACGWWNWTVRDVAALVHADIERRIGLGVRQYGERLAAHNGRDALQDAYEEALDLALYLRQALAERGDG